MCVCVWVCGCVGVCLRVTGRKREKKIREERSINGFKETKGGKALRRKRKREICCIKGSHVKKREE